MPIRASDLQAAMVEEREMNTATISETLSDRRRICLLLRADFLDISLRLVRSELEQANRASANLR